jgi:FdhD protein
MPLSNSSISFEVLTQEAKARRSDRQALIREEPLSIQVQGHPYAVVMRTPGEELAHVAGFCLAEGILENLNHIGAITFCDAESNNAVTLTVTPERLPAIAGVLDRRGFVSQTSCGVCGKEMVEDLLQKVRPLPDGPPIDLEKALYCLKTLETQQHLYRRTRATHAAALYTVSFEQLSVAEDVGRHNALDKAVGKLLLKGILHRAQALILSSRISYEMVQKAARAEIPFILAASRPTALAVELADSVNMTLASAKESEIHVYSGFRRLAEVAGKTV